MTQQYLPESQPDPIPDWMTQEVRPMTEQQAIERDFDVRDMKAKGTIGLISFLFLLALLAFCVTCTYAATTTTRQGGSADFACCEDADCKTPVGSQYARDWAAKDACAALVEADGKTRYFRQWPMRVEKTGSPPPTCPPAPAPITRTQQCPAGTTGVWEQTSASTVGPPPACTITTTWAPTAPPAGSCPVTPTPPPTPNLVYATSVGGTYLPLQGAHITGPITVKLDINCASIPAGLGGPWKFILDSVDGNTESSCPFSYVDDDAMTSFAPGQRLLSATSPGAPVASAGFTVTPPALVAPQVSATQTPNSINPTNVNVVLSWAIVAEATSYEVQRDRPSGCSGTACSVFALLSATDKLTYTNSNLPPGFTYNYRVRATDATRQGPWSATVKVVTATITLGSATLNWTPPTQNTDGTTLTDLAGYRIDYGPVTAQGPNFTQSVTVSNAGALTYTVTGLTSGQWAFAVSAFTSAGLYSAQSNVAQKAVP